jgi:hypothetical protein
MLDAKEREALNLIMGTLESLEPPARTRLMLYLRGLLDAFVHGATVAAPQPATIEEGAKGEGPVERTRVTDIRHLKEQKKPRTDVEMAALVAYYLQNEAPANERKDQIESSDIEKFFKQARHPLPTRLGMTLTNAKNAGYLDQVGQGTYRLNAVGYNLVVHQLPAASGTVRGASKSRSVRRPVRRTASKAAVRRPAARRAATRRATAQRATTRKTAARRTTVRKATSRKAVARKAVRKTTTKRAGMRAGARAAGGSSE